MPWDSMGVGGYGEISLLGYTVCTKHPKAELYNDDTLVKSMSSAECTSASITNGGFVTTKFWDRSTEAYTFNKIVLKRDPYTAPDGSSKDVILTIDIPEGKAKTADKELLFFIRLTLTTTSG